MSLSVMLGLKPPILPDGKVRTNRAFLKEEKERIEKNRNLGAEIVRDRACVLYEQAFRELGYKATSVELSKHMNGRYVYKWLIKYKNKLVKQTKAKVKGKTKDAIVWQWIDI